MWMALTEFRKPCRAQGLRYELLDPPGSVTKIARPKGYFIVHRALEDLVLWVLEDVADPSGQLRYSMAARLPIADHDTTARRP